MTTDKYGPIDFEDQFFLAFAAGNDAYNRWNEEANGFRDHWGMWVDYQEWLEAKNA